MREMTADPVGSGVNTALKVMQGFQMAERMQDDREQRQRQKQMWAREDESYFGQKNLNMAASAYDKLSKSNGDLDKAGLSEEEELSLLPLATKKGLIKDGKVDSGKLNSLNILDNVIKNDPQLNEAMKNGQKASIDLSKHPEVEKALHDVYGDNFDQGVDKYGNKSSKKANKIFVDFSNPEMPTVAFGLHITPPQNGAANMVPLQGYENNVFTIPETEGKLAAGQTEKGNIDLSKRKVSLNPDGSISTVLSMSIEVDGKEVLIPRVSPEGKVLSPEEAVKLYKKTGQHLGKFDDANSADQYAEKLHSSKLWQPSMDYYVKGKEGYDSVMTWGRNGDPKAPVQQIPAPLLSMQIGTLKDVAGHVSQLEAKYGPTVFSQKVQQAEAKRKEGSAVMKAFESSGGTDFTKFAETLLKENPEMDMKDAKVWFDALQKSRPKMGSQKGKEMEDRTRIVAEFGENSPEVKKFDESTKPKEAGANKTIYGPKGQTKEVFINKGEDYVPPKSWSLKAPKETDPTAHQTRIDSEVDKVEGYFARHYKDDAKTVDDTKLDDAAKERLREKVKAAEDYVRKGKGSANEAYHKFDVKKEKSAPKPITKDIKKEIAEQFKDMPNGPAKVKKMEEEAKRRGYDPSKTNY
jgi:hypothetical protein